MTGATPTRHGIVDCPVCASGRLRHGLRQRDVPVHSVVLHRSREEARSQPCGRIDLACCGSCGFVFNVAFDPSLQHYRHDYEATQAFSGTFNKFDEQVARMVMTGCEGRAGAVVEVGCGQGEFLARLHEHGLDRLVGFDPAFDPARSRIADQRGIAIHPVRFDIDAVTGPVAAIVCKMTLEHIARPVEFVAQLAGVARQNDDCPVFIQVPDAEQVFRSAAFWDVYYEHCNYFTARSLEHVLARAGLAVVDMRAGFAGQYLICTAVPAAGTTASDVSADGDSAGFEAFCSAAEESIEYWRQWAADVSAGGRLALWGGGSKAVAFLSATAIAGRIHAAIDINPRKADTFLAGSAVPVVSPQDAGGMDISHVLLLNPVYRAEVSQMMAEHGIHAQLTAMAE